MGSFERPPGLGLPPWCILVTLSWLWGLLLSMASIQPDTVPPLLEPVSHTGHSLP